MSIIPFSRPVSRSKYPANQYRMVADGKTGEITLYGVIGDQWDGITAAQFSTDLKALGSVSLINIHLNSPGGFVTDGLAIFNRLKSHSARKVVTIDGEASSIASLIAMAGDEIHMGEGALMLVHGARGELSWATEEDALRLAANLKVVNRNLVATYMNKTKMTEFALRALMKEDRYMSAEEAVSLGFADSRDMGNRIAALKINRGEFGLPPLPSADRSKVSARAKLEAAIARHGISASGQGSAVRRF